MISVAPAMISGIKSQPKLLISQGVISLGGEVISHLLISLLLISVTGEVISVVGEVIS